MILIDTSVWVRYLRQGDRRLVSLLEEEQVVCHPFIIGELACGALKNRREILTLLATLPMATVAEHEEVLNLIESRTLYARGIGWVDAHLIASALLTPIPLWTLDVKLGTVATSLRIAS